MNETLYITLKYYLLKLIKSLQNVQLFTRLPEILAL